MQQGRAPSASGQRCLVPFQQGHGPNRCGQNAGVCCFLLSGAEQELAVGPHAGAPCQACSAHRLPLTSRRHRTASGSVSARGGWESARLCDLSLWTVASPVVVCRNTPVSCHRFHGGHLRLGLVLLGLLHSGNPAGGWGFACSEEGPALWPRRLLAVLSSSLSPLWGGVCPQSLAV